MKNPFWGIFEDSVNSKGIKLEREIFPAGTDSRLLRALGIQALGFSPMRKTPILLHEHNEALSISTFLEGVSIYEKVIDDLANATRQTTETALNGNAKNPIDDLFCEPCRG